MLTVTSWIDHFLCSKAVDGLVVSVNILCNRHMLYELFKFFKININTDIIKCYQSCWVEFTVM